MKTWTLRFRAVDKKIFDQVKNGTKSVETRAATTKFQPIQEGDTLVMVCVNERLEKKIVKKHHFPSVDALTKKITYKKVMPSVSSIDEMKKVYASFPGYEQKINEFGIFAFELE